jgi:hypothetical protein
LKIASDNQVCQLKPGQMLVDEHSDGHYVVLKFQVACPTTVSGLAINYQLLFDLDRQHRGLFKLSNFGSSQTHIFSPEKPLLQLELNNGGRTWQEFKNFSHEGVWHIWAGYDHLLFLISLLLPSALIRSNQSWQPQLRYGEVFFEVAKVVTSFTIAHSITLSLTALGYISLPSRLVESAIAASVLFAALNNIYPIYQKRRTLLAFSFGLIHGMGIASVLLDMGLEKAQRVWSLLGFNIGVELGQLFVVALVLPFITLLSRNRHYPNLALRWGSAMIAGIALVWLAERSLDFKMLNL